MSSNSMSNFNNQPNYSITRKNSNENISSKHVCINGNENKNSSPTLSNSKRTNLIKQDQIDLNCKNENNHQSKILNLSQKPRPEEKELVKNDVQKDNGNNHDKLLNKKLKTHSISICIDSVDDEKTEMKMGKNTLGDGTDNSQVGTISTSDKNDDNYGVEELTKEIEILKVNNTAKNNCSDKLNVGNENQSSNNDLLDKKRSKPLIRSGAVRESSLSPPPSSNNMDIGGENNTGSNKSSNNNHLTVSYSNNNNANVNLPTSSIISSDTSSPSLSRDSSSEIQELSVFEAKSFLTETLRKSLKDRRFLYKIEQEFIKFVNDSKETYTITDISSYNRMLIHKTADYFQLEHRCDHNHTTIILSKNQNTRLPEETFKDMMNNIHQQETDNDQKKLILKRDSTSLDDSPSSSFDKDKSPDNSYLNGSLSDSSRSRSLEEREENYEKVRARIFNQDSNQTSKCSNEDDSNNENNGQRSVNILNKCQEASSASSLQNESQTNCDKNDDISLINNNNDDVNDTIGDDNNKELHLSDTKNDNKTEVQQLINAGNNNRKLSSNNNRGKSFYRNKQQQSSYNNHDHYYQRYSQPQFQYNQQSHAYNKFVHSSAPTANNSNFYSYHNQNQPRLALRPTPHHHTISSHYDYSYMIDQKINYQNNNNYLRFQTSHTGGHRMNSSGPSPGQPPQPLTHYVDNPNNPYLLRYSGALNQYPIENNSQYPLPSLLNPSLPIQNEFYQPIYMNQPTTLLGQQGPASGPLLTTPPQTANVPINQHAQNTVATNPQINTNSQTQYSNLTHIGNNYSLLYRNIQPIQPGPNAATPLPYSHHHNSQATNATQHYSYNSAFPFPVNIITPTNVGIGKNDPISNDHHPPRNQPQVTHVQYPLFKPIGPVQEPSPSGIHPVKNTKVISKPLFVKQSNVQGGPIYKNNYKYNNNSTIGNQNKYQSTTQNVRTGNDFNRGGTQRTQDNLNKTHLGGGGSINRTNIKH